MEGSETFSQTIANMAVLSQASLGGAQFTLEQELRSADGELAADQIPVAKREGAKLQRLLPGCARRPTRGGLGIIPERTRSCWLRSKRPTPI